MDYLQYLYVQYLEEMEDSVLNLVINGLPSILNTKRSYSFTNISVLNLVINGLPSIRGIEDKSYELMNKMKVLNLVINGLPSIHCKQKPLITYHLLSFKPCYKWITFNTIR